MLIPFTSASFTNLSGLAVADGAEVEVRLELNGALAALFDDRDGTTPLTNPFNADSQGRFEFYVAGRIDGYSIQVTKGAQTHTLRHQLTGSAAATLFDNTGTGLVAESVQDAIEEIAEKPPVSVTNFGAVADGAFTMGGSASGTDNLAFFQAADAAVVANGGGFLVVPAGVYRLSGKYTKSRGVVLKGEGTGHVPIFLTGTAVRASILLVSASAGDDCVAFTENTGHSGIEDISIYNTNTNEIRSVVNCTGVLHPRMKNVEMASLRKCGGSTSAGLLVKSSASSPNFETLYGHFENCVVNITEMGTANEASVSIGLKIQGTNSALKPSANKFIGGDFQGRIKPLLITGDAASARPTSNTFYGTAFDCTYNTDMEHVYVANGSKVIGYGTVEHVYVVKFVGLEMAESTSFHGCYFEMGGTASTFDDGSNGVEPLLAVVALNSSTEVVRTDLLGCKFIAYLYDNGIQTECNPTTAGYRYSTRQIPKLTVRKNAAQTIPHNTLTDITFPSVLEGADAQLDYASPTATIREPGSYLITWKVTMVGWGTAGTYGFTRLITTDVSFDGGHFHDQGAGVPISSEGCVMVTLNLGSTAKIQMLHVEGNNQDTTADSVDNWLTIVKLG